VRLENSKTISSRVMATIPSLLMLVTGVGIFHWAIRRGHRLQQ
jgi:hypothetical protein